MKGLLFLTVLATAITHSPVTGLPKRAKVPTPTVNEFKQKNGKVQRYF